MPSEIEVRVTKVTVIPKVSDARLRATLMYYRRYWPAGELVKLLEELERRRASDRTLPASPDKKEVERGTGS